MEPVTVSASQVDLGAKALREFDMHGRITRSWEDLPSSDKRKWREKARVVLRAALAE
jgi:hypothetical protein